MRKNLQCLIGIALMQVAATNSPGTFIDKSAELGFTGTAGRWAVAWADYNNDGYVDLYDGFTWKNNEGKGFTKLAHPHRSTGIFADYDNDGYLDLFISDSPASSALYRNIAGTGEFAKQEMATMPMDCSMCLAWADLNGDGYVDLYVGGGNPSAQTDAVFMNHDGNFFTVEPFGGNLYTRGVNACDYDEDNDMDVLAARYWFQPNQLWQNDGAGNLSDVGGGAGVHGAGHTISAAFADMDNDGHFDLFACNFNHHDNRRSEDAILYKNMGPEGSWQFDKRFTFDGGDWQESYASCALADYDNDGDMDIFITTVYGGDHARLYRNDGDWSFTNVTAAEGLGGIGSSMNYQAAWGDYDNDGDVDLVTDGRLFQNQGNANHWLRVRLTGNGHDVNHAAIGAQVRIVVPDLGTLVRQVESGTGQGNQSDLVMHFGLGGHSTRVDLEVSWPDGTKQTITSIAVDQTINVFYAQISGSTWFDLDGDSVRDGDEPGVVGSTIYLDQNNNGQLDDGETTTTTTANGDYGFGGLAPATYTVAEVMQVGWTRAYPPDSTAHTVALAVGESVRDLNFGYQAQIRGTKWHDLDGDGIRDADEPGIAGSRIFLDTNNNGRLDYNGLSTECVGNPVDAGWTGHALNGSNVRFDAPEVGWLKWHGNPGAAISTGAAGTYKANTKAGGWTIEWATNRVSTSGDATQKNVIGIDDDTNNIRVQFDADPADGGGVTLLDGMPAAAGGGSSVRFAYDVRSGYHVFRLQRKKGSGSVELYVDDVLAGSITPVAARLPWSDASNLNNVYWGNSHWEEDFDYFRMGAGDVPFTETTATTDANGAYAFGGLALGTYKVTEVTKKGWTQTYPPNPGSHEVNVTAGAVATGVDFGNKPPPAAIDSAK